LLDKIKNELSEDQIYIIEKYQLGLHQDEEKEYESWFKEMLTDLEISKSKHITIYKKDYEILYKYNEKNNWFWIDYDKIWSIFQLIYHLNYNEITLITKGMVEEQLNLKIITTMFHVDINNILNERLHTKTDAENVINLIKKNISDEAVLIGGFGKGKKTSEHDIDILIPDRKFNDELKNKLFNLLNAESVEDTDWGGWYFNNTNFGDIDIFYTTSEFDY
jgi:hypothetical protein